MGWNLVSYTLRPTRWLKLPIDYSQCFLDLEVGVCQRRRASSRGIVRLYHPTPRTNPNAKAMGNILLGFGRREDG
jgi:hypothetical protein